MENIERFRREDGLVTLKKEFEGKKTVVGTNEVIRKLKSGKIKKIYVSTSLPKKVLDIEEVKKIEKEIINVDAMELGKSLGKNFPISIVGVLK